METLILLQDLEREGYAGTDVSTDIALYEYGLLWGKDKHCGEDEYRFIYRIEGSECDPEDKQVFGAQRMSKKEFIDMLNEDWYVVDNVFGYIGWTESVEEYIEGFPANIGDSLQYYGHFNIFGEGCGDTMHILYTPPESFGSFLEEHGISKEKFLKSYYMEDIILAQINTIPISGDLLFNVEWDVLGDYEDMEDLAELWAALAAMDPEIPLGIEII